MDKKKVYEDKLQAQLDEWGAQIDTLKAKAAKIGAEGKIRYLEEIETLQEKRGEAQSKLRELNRRGDDAWEELKDGLEEAWKDLGDAMSEAISRLR